MVYRIYFHHFVVSHVCALGVRTELQIFGGGAARRTVVVENGTGYVGQLLLWNCNHHRLIHRLQLEHPPRLHYRSLPMPRYLRSITYKLPFLHVQFGSELHYQQLIVGKYIAYPVDIDLAFELRHISILLERQNGILRYVPGVSYAVTAFEQEQSLIGEEEGFAFLLQQRIGVLLALDPLGKGFLPHFLLQLRAYQPHPLAILHPCNNNNNHAAPASQEAQSD